MRARAVLCWLCRLRYHDAREVAKQRWPLAAALSDLLILSDFGFRGDTTPEDRGLVRVERIILGRLGIVTLEGRGDDEAVTRLAARAKGLFVTT